MSADPPEKIRLRALTAAAFIPSRIHTAWQPLADETARDFADSLAVCSCPADLMRMVAHPLPVRIMSRILGLPEDDAPVIRAWSNTMLPASNADRDERAAADEAFTEYLQDTVAWYVNHGEPGTLLADLIAARGPDGDRLSHGDLVSTVHTFILAGHETAAAVIGFGAFSLLADVGAWARLGSDPDMVPAAVEDILKGAVPGYGTPQLVTEGAGVDYDLGISLAKVELRAAFGVFSARLPTLRLAMEAGAMQWTAGTVVRGPVELLVDW